MNETQHFEWEETWGCGIERTLPEKPNSRLQKYHLTAKGRALIH